MSHLTFVKKGTVSYAVDQKVSSPKLATFDLDHTLVRPKSGAKFANDADDWELHFPNVFEVLQKYADDGYKLVIFTNQLGVSKGKTKLDHLHEKFNQIRTQLDRPFDVFIATDEDYFRKPHTGMWELYLSHYPDLTVDLDNSFYCGDAAGRPKGWQAGAPKDFSSSDLYYAHNVGLPFRVPEQIFGQLSLTDETYIKDPYVTNPELNWKQYLKPVPPVLLGKQPEMVIMVGPAASGKSTYTNQYVKHGYVHINQDTLKTKAKCLKKAKEAVEAGRSLVIDNTNPDIAARKAYLDLLQNGKVTYHVVALEMTTPLSVCHHLNFLRVQKTKGGTRRIPQVAYNLYKSKHVTPTKEEGFNLIRQVPFRLNEADSQLREFNFHYLMN